MPGSLRCCACSRHLRAPRAAPTSSPTFQLASSPARSATTAVIAARPLAPGRRAAAHPHHGPPHRPLSTSARPATPSSRFRLPTSASSSSSSSSSSTSTSPVRPLSTTAAARAAVVDSSNPFPFPRAKDPSPFDIFHFRRDQVLTAKDVKSRYLQLVKIYHPDRRAAASASSSSSSKKGKHKAAPDADHEFKAIVAAYELLSSPSRRETYLRSGLGWGATASYRGGGGGGGGGASPSSPWSQSTAEYHFRRGRPMSHGRWAGQYDHWSWSQTWSDPHSPHFRPEDEQARRSGGMSSGGAGAGGGSTTAPGWEGQGLFARNGVVFLVLAALTLTVTPLTAWSVVPSAPKGVDPFAPGSDGVRMSELAARGGLEGGSAWMPRVYDKRHQDAAANLHRARLEARERGHEKRDAIKRRVEELRRVQAFDRARDVQAVEQGKSGTGHLALPAPAGSTTGE
ncbi:hypothetical protein JCM8208_001968 [Rhodotorula glutinis]